MNLRRLLFPFLLLLMVNGCTHMSFDVNNPAESDPDQRNALLHPAEDSPASSHPSSVNGMKGVRTVAFDLAHRSTDSSGNYRKGAVSGADTLADGQETDALPGQSDQSDLDEALELCQLSQEYWQQGELEKALDALDRAYGLILSADTSDEPKLIQQKEDLRFMISKRILEIYASRNIVINGNHHAIPISLNRHVQAEIDRFTKGRERRFFMGAYKRSGRYRDKIISALKAAGLPQELSWLPLIESGFKVNALSHSRALGMWQFIPSTGYKFGLSRDTFIDERMDPEKSTEAAIEYLKELHQIFGDWSTVLAAYNCGEGRVLRLIRSQNINYLDNFWDLYERLPRETARYVPRFLATLHILNNPATYGLDDISLDPPLAYETVEINRQVHLKNVAQSIGVDAKTLEELNPELRYSILPGDSYHLNIPPGSREMLMAKIDHLPVSHPPRRAFVYHRVRPGESLSVIARRYHTSVGKIMRANNMSRSNYIVAGKRLKIPQNGYMSSAPRTVQPDNGEALNHVVQKGDSLFIIANRFGTTIKKLQDLNHLTATTLYIGQVLTIFPGKMMPAPAVDGLATYEVKQGDSPFQIARRHKMPLNRFLRLNQLYPGSTIFPGQKVYIE